jgi:hypothetical protein
MDFKNSIIISKLASILFFVWLHTPTFAQKKGLFSRKSLINQYATVGIGGGSSHYYGDLSPYSSPQFGLYTNVRWNGTLNYTRHLTPRAAARFSYTFARIFGDDYTYSQRNFDNKQFTERYLRNLHFRNDLQEFTISGLFNLLPQYGKGARGRKSFMPFIGIGIGILGQNPKARVPVADKTSGNYMELSPSGKPELQPWVALRNYRTSGQSLPGSTTKPYSLVQPVLPLSLGFRMKLTDNIDFLAEASLRITNTDYLDDVAPAPYPDQAKLLSSFGTLSPWLSYRADEDIHAVSGESRIPLFINALTNLGAATGGAAPSVSAKTIYNTATYQRASSKLPDSYLLTQFTISYIISNRLKCPPIR